MGHLDMGALLSGVPAIILSALSAWWARRAHREVKPQPDDPTGEHANGDKTLRQEQARLAVMMGQHFGEEVWPSGPAHRPRDQPRNSGKVGLPRNRR